MTIQETRPRPRGRPDTVLRLRAAVGPGARSPARSLTKADTAPPLLDTTWCGAITDIATGEGGL